MIQICTHYTHSISELLITIRYEKRWKKNKWIRFFLVSLQMKAHSILFLSMFLVTSANVLKLICYFMPTAKKKYMLQRYICQGFGPNIMCFFCCLGICLNKLHIMTVLMEKDSILKWWIVGHYILIKKRRNRRSLVHVVFRFFFFA